MTKIFSFTLLLLSNIALAQTKLSGTVRDGKTDVPIESVLVTVLSSTDKTVTDEQGRFLFPRTKTGDTLQFQSVGYETATISISAFRQAGNAVVLSPKSIQLDELKITTGIGQQYKSISKVDINLRGINNSQEVLRMVPGLFIGQHAGGGKAEQIFLRGFDLDHGTDINIAVDGMPVNMVSHAHGQGYADLHFLIPELIENVTFKKGMYDADKGNFATTGSVDFKTANALPNSSIKVEAGMFNTVRTVGLFNLLNGTAKKRGQAAYLASEYMYTNGYFDHPQRFNRINLFGKYHGTLGKRHLLRFSASTFASQWDASGQIPDRAVESGRIGFYGAIDPNEGGRTSRTNINALLTSTLNNGSYFQNQLYFSRYGFQLYSNFTFFKNDTVNGDQIRQKEARNLFGYNGSYHRVNYWGKVQLTSEAGVNLRLDRTLNSELSHTANRTTTINPLMLGNIAENNVAAYLSEGVVFSQKFSANAGLRYDFFTNRYLDKLNSNKEEKASAFMVSPKLNVVYHPSQNVQVYWSAGKGFHSNDTRVVVPQNGLQVLPAAYGADLGTVLKPAKNLLLNAAVWYLWLDQEFVYVGDEGVVEPSGRSRRYGADVSVRYQPLAWLFADVDLNYAHARAVDQVKGEDYLPLAPQLTSIGGLTVKRPSGVNASLRYRYMGNRPANEDNSLIAKGYFVTDANIGFQRGRYEVALNVQNLFNVKWKETQFDTESRLQAEAAPVSEIHFTPGTPFFFKLGFTYSF